MKVFVTGGSGYIGRSVLRVLQERGDEVTALARSDKSATVISELGATPVRGELTEVDLLRDSAAAADGVIHLALTGDERSGEIDQIASDALSEGAGRNPYVHTGGAWTWGNTAGEVDEDAPYDPPLITAWRVAGEERVLATRKQGRHPVVISPGLVYGRQGGLPGFFAWQGSEKGAVPYLGDGGTHWSLVHVDDIAELYVLALKAPAGGRYLGTVGQNPTTKEFAEALSQAVGIPGKTVSVSVAELSQSLGMVADALALDQRFNTTRARDELGWQPKHLDVLDDLARGV
ncbi:MULTISPECIES: NAD-dependent epimerase/dehydratase family protein [Actinomadura]|uniref:NAD-dependent epimerase/dehydratase family protein n=1 Tax=Actinomadura litoris TaxID=2678616 RepID=A0A7K1L564_9ACTN|nr:MULTISPECIES: NAD-dependent epimerase/dehydratase family protein [Actinomadura]MBT2212410.1 NAD-dependent epimerase/dehydratase family protein [Actinomadura sp. NEAU-AAG7]MUN39395.1 NAD-dependent epimerase/dehydratase family protein [Actinomadura litoris]